MHMGTPHRNFHLPPEIHRVPHRLPFVGSAAIFNGNNNRYLSSSMNVDIILRARAARASLHVTWRAPPAEHTHRLAYMIALCILPHRALCCVEM